MDPRQSKDLEGTCSHSLCQYHLSPFRSQAAIYMPWKAHPVTGSSCEIWESIFANYNRRIKYTVIAVCLILAGLISSRGSQHSWIHSTQSRGSPPPPPCLLCELHLTKCLVVTPFLVALSKWSKDLNSGPYKGPQLGLIPAIKSIGI